MRENKILEYKETVESNTFLKTVSAFANYGSGNIMFGISDNGDIKGINNPTKACLIIENKINDNIKPAPQFTLDIKNDNTIVLEVYEGVFKPYLYKGKAYKRNDSSSLEVERVELNRLVLEGQNLTFEDMTSEKQNLEFSTLEEELIKALSVTGLSQDILKTLALYNMNGKFNNAAVLLSDHNQFKGVDIIKFGDNIDEIMDRETLENISIISLLKKSVSIFKKYYLYEKIEGTSRTKVELIPEKAFRESIANALVHRLWDVNAYIRISMYSDKVEITSPGGLLAGISEEEYINGQVSLLRNPIIGNVFYRLKYIEKFGTGILRIKNAYSDALVKPQFKVYDNSITIILPVISSQYKLNKDELIVVGLLKNNLKLSRLEIENSTCFGKDKIIRILNELIKKNIVSKTGKARAVKYFVSK